MRERCVSIADPATQYWTISSSPSDQGHSTTWRCGSGSCWIGRSPSFRLFWQCTWFSCCFYYFKGCELNDDWSKVCDVLCASKILTELFHCVHKTNNDGSALKKSYPISRAKNQIWLSFAFASTKLLFVNCRLSPLSPIPSLTTHFSRVTHGILVMYIST